jgi:general secretion pathway protein J
MNNGNSKSKRCRQKGFTLVELLVGLILLGLILVVLAGALRIGLIGARTVDDRSGWLSEVRTVQGIIRRAVESSRPEVWRDGATRKVGFSGSEQSLDLIADLPAWSNIAGPYIVRFALEVDALVMIRRVTSGDRQRFDFNRPVERRTLLRGVAGMRFSYFGIGERRLQRQWWPSWSGRAVLPKLVRLEIDFSNGERMAWPVLIAQPMIGLRQR